MEDLYIKKTQHTSLIHLKAFKHPKLRVRSMGGGKKLELSVLHEIYFNE